MQTTIKSPHQHSQRLIARGDFASVHRCECGGIQLTIGALTLRLTTAALLSLTATLEEAAGNCEQAGPARALTSFQRGDA